MSTTLVPTGFAAGVPASVALTADIGFWVALSGFAVSVRDAAADGSSASGLASFASASVDGAAESVLDGRGPNGSRVPAVFFAVVAAPLAASSSTESALPGVALPGVALPGVALPGVALPGVALPGV
ncbi:hypothetical protein, partial [Actinoplanes sp. ATCC 53533]|uniref:hypothetical protein n=1 Tax=Actinoplanes sp. ATCC 53533 TaxID=1288362 RepID=UPI003515AACF